LPTLGLGGNTILLLYFAFPFVLFCILSYTSVTLSTFIFNYFRSLFPTPRRPLRPVLKWTPIGDSYAHGRSSFTSIFEQSMSLHTTPIILAIRTLKAMFYI